MENDKIKDLEVKFPRRLIKNRLIGSGDRKRMVDYVAGSHIIKRLNECFKQEWSFEVKDKIIDFEHGQILVLGKLSVPCSAYQKNKSKTKSLKLTSKAKNAEAKETEEVDYENEDFNNYWIEKQQWGGTFITRYVQSRQIVDLGNDMKIATTDSLKKCATLFGIGLHLYDEDEVISTFEPDDAPESDNKSPELKGKINPKELSSKNVQMTQKDKPCSIQQIATLRKVLAKDNILENNLLLQCSKQNLNQFSYEEAGRLITKDHEFWKSVMP